MYNLKKTSIGITSIVFTYLFYHQGIGLNLFILSLFLSLLSLFNDYKSVTKKTYIYLVILNSISYSAFYFADSVSIFFTIIGIILIPFFTLDTSKIALLAIPNQFGNNIKVLMEGIYKVLDIKYFDSQSQNRFIPLFLVPSIIIIVFIWIYSMANETFYDLIIEIICLIDIQFIIFLIFSFILAYIFWNYQSNRAIELKYKKIIDQNYETSTIDVEWSSNSNSWFKSGIILFGFLDFILCVFINSEFIQLNEIKTTLNSSLNYSNSSQIILDIFNAVQSSVNSIIISIVFAITLIFFYFRKQLNFNTPNKILNYLAYIWIILNCIIILSATAKVYYSIDYSGYTIKRLGVYAFLILSLFGLIFTFIKIYYKKTNFFVVRKMIWVFGITLAIISPINWSAWITRINYDLLATKNKPIEIWRLIHEISYNHIELYPYLKLDKVSNEEKLIISTKMNEYPKNVNYNFQEQNLYDNKVNYFIKKIHEIDSSSLFKINSNDPFQNPS